MTDEKQGGFWQKLREHLVMVIIGAIVSALGIFVSVFNQAITDFLTKGNILVAVQNAESLERVVIQLQGSKETLEKMAIGQKCKVSPGSYEVKVRGDGQELFSRVINVRPRRTEKVVAKLPSKGEILVVAEGGLTDKDAVTKVYSGQEFIVQTELDRPCKLYPGFYKVVVSKNEETIQTRDVNVESGKTKKIGIVFLPVTIQGEVRSALNVEKPVSGVLVKVKQNEFVTGDDGVYSLSHMELESFYEIFASKQNVAWKGSVINPDLRKTVVKNIIFPTP